MSVCRRKAKTGVFMSDLIYVGIIVVFFIVADLYVRFCDRL